jgi:hypothetical protein
MSSVLRAVAVSDGVFLLCAFILQTAVNIIPASTTMSWLDRAYAQYYVWPVMMATQMSTVWLTVLVSLERYVAICYPLRAAAVCTMSKARRAVAVISIGSVVYNLPRYFEMAVDTELAAMVRTPLGADPYFRYIYNCALYALCLYILPLGALVWLNLSLVLALRRGRRRWQSLQVRQKREQNLTVIPLTIVLVFFVCGSPALTVNVVDSIAPHLVDERLFVKLMLVANFLVILNSASNFVIYCLLGKKFRTRLLELCSCNSQRRRMQLRRGFGARYSTVHLHQPQMLQLQTTQISDF